MPAKKKEKQKDFWAVKCDGFLVEVVETKSTATEQKSKYEKLYPTHMKFSIEPFLGKTAHCTTA